MNLNKLEGKLPIISVALSFLVFGAFYLISLNLYSVELFSGDAWHLVDVAFSDVSIPEGFAAQHGPHRIGLAFLMHKIAVALGVEYAYTHALIQSFIWLCCALLALSIVYKERGKLVVWDAVIPVIFANVGLLPATIYSPYIHGFTPLFILTLIKALQWNNGWRKFFFIAIVLFCSAFTFNANLLVGAFAIMALVEWVKSHERFWLYLLLYLVGLFVWIFFTTNFDQLKSTLEVGFSVGDAAEYVVELISAPVFYSADNSVLWGAILFTVLTFGFLFFPFYRHRGKGEFLRIQNLLVITLLLFWAANTYTRWSSGGGNAHASRYYPMVTVLLFTFYWSALFCKWKYKNYVVSAAVLLSLYIWNTGRKARFELANKSYQSSTYFLRDNLNPYEEAQWLESLHPFPERVHVKRSLERIRSQEE